MIINYAKFLLISIVLLPGITDNAIIASTTGLTSSTHEAIRPGLFVVSKSGDYGYINGQGELKIPFQYSVAQPFSNGLAVVKPKDINYVGYIDKSGNFIDQQRFLFASSFINEIAYASLPYNFDSEPSFVVLNKTSHGLTATHPVLGIPRSIRERMIIFTLKSNNNHLFGVVNAQGEIVVYPRKGFINSFSEGLAMAVKHTQDKNLCGYINGHGSWIIPAKYDVASNFRNGLAGVKSNNGDWKYIGHNGHVSVNVKPAVSSVGVFSEGLAVVVRNTKSGLIYGYIDEHGYLRIPFKYEFAFDFNEGLAAVEIQKKIDQVICEKWGYIDHGGKWVIKPKYDYAGNFDRGLAHVRIGKMIGPNTHGLIDRQGNWVWQTTENDSNTNKVPK